MEQSLISVAEIEPRFREVQARIQAAAKRGERDAGRIRLIAVTKSHPPQVLRAAYQLGLRAFGENRVEEGLPKQQDLADLSEIEWHMIGHIQSRKAEAVVAGFQVVHSVDRMKIARRLDRYAGEHGRQLRVMVECNVSGEASKYGWQLSAESEWRAVVDQFNEIQAMPNLEVLGLMTMAPMVADPEQVRPVFRRLRKLRDFLWEAVSEDWTELSMGMTDDYQVAIEEGATLLRIGRAIFGPRQAR